MNFLTDEGIVHTVMGGGMLELDSTAQSVSIYGASYGYPWAGKPMHNIAKKLLQEHLGDSFTIHAEVCDLLIPFFVYLAFELVPLTLRALNVYTYRVKMRLEPISVLHTSQYAGRGCALVSVGAPEEVQPLCHHHTSHRALEPASCSAHTSWASG